MKVAVVNKKLSNSGIAKAFKTLTVENTLANDGGLSSFIIPRQVNAAGATLIIGGSVAVAAGKEGIVSKNKASLGRVSYDAGMARMTRAFTSGGIEAMHRASRGNPDAFSDMANEALGAQSLGGEIETYGATPELISALYHMGGR